MKKILALALSLMVAGLTVTGCGGEKKLPTQSLQLKQRLPLSISAPLMTVATP